MCGQQRNSPMADSIFVWEPDLDPKVGQPSGILLPADVLQQICDPVGMSVSVNTCFFALCVPLCFLYSMSLNFSKKYGLKKV